MQDTDAQRKRLEAERLELSKNIASLTESTQPIAPDVSLGRLTRMEAISAKGVQESALRDAQARLGEIEGALARLDGAGYGLCKVCGQPISPARLEFMPECSTCVNCAS